MNRLFFIIILLLTTSISFTQADNQLYTIKASIIDANTKEPLPFATVYNKQLSKGTASNVEGYFELPNNRLGDTIVVSYLGYSDEIIIVSDEVSTMIKLSPSSSILDEIVVKADDGYLYDIVSKVKRKKRTKTKKAKTYFFLETKMFGQPIEIIESYFNGNYSNFGIDDLNLKKGRIGLKPINRRYFRSTESSRLFSMHDVFAESNQFPGNPLSMKKKELESNYTLTRKQVFTENQSKIYVIDFIPVDGESDLFAGTIWIDQKNNKLIKIRLQIENASVHPFIPIGFNTIQEVDMEITKSYETIDGEQFINAIDFTYVISYNDTWGNQLKARTEAFTKAYDYENKFKLPNFEFTPHYHEDYRNITVSPYDSVFWNQTSEFRFYDRLQEIEDFILENKIDNNVLYPNNKIDTFPAQLQFPYIAWHPNRFKMKEAPAEIIEKSKRSGAFEIDRYHLDVKLYLDSNMIQDSIIYQVCSILDPVGTYYHFYITPTDLAFMNMYFDVMEIQKRKLELELSQSQNLTIDYIDNLYAIHLEEFKKTSKDFLKDTNRGQNTKGMQKWNDIIQESLHIDNLSYFKIK